MALFATTTTAQNIMDSVGRDIRQTLDSTDAPAQTIMLDWINRISLDLQRASRWQFLLSDPQLFVTQLGVIHYWVGATGGNANNQSDTGLNLTNLRTIKAGTVYDRSNNRPLWKADEGPLLSKLEFPDDTYRLARPEQWRQSPTTPNVIDIFPAPDNENIYQPQPEPPIVTTISGGALPARIYWVTSTYVDSLGNESTAPLAAKIFVPANFLLVVQPPVEPVVAGSAGVKYNRWNVYANAIDSQSSVLQASNLSTSVDFTEPGTGLITNSTTPPSDNQVEPVDGYIIEFRYYHTRTKITTANQVLQIPDDYSDIVVAGTNAYTFAFLSRPVEVQQWKAIYKEGITSIIRDMNLFPRGNDFIKPDGASIGGYLLDGQTQDLFLN